MAARQHGYLAAGALGGRFLVTEISKLPKAARLALLARLRRAPAGRHPTMNSDTIVADLARVGLELHPYRVDLAAFRAHEAAHGYPRNYAGGPLEEGGMREQKLLEYFVSLDLLAVRPLDVVVDVASEWSIFPEVLRRISGATVYRQDLMYAPGVHGDRIGGSAAHMPVPDGFADKLVLHNAFEHFEGTADSDFIVEAWRVLKPGGTLCILPLFMSDQYSILTDPLVDRRDIMWDDGARVIELPWWHNRFGRFYDAESLQRRVLAPAGRFRNILYHIENTTELHPRSYLHFALVLRKPDVGTRVDESKG